jgi:hypothetical protein
MSYPAAAAGQHMQAAPAWASLLEEIGISATDLYHQIIGAVERGSGDAVLSWDDFTFAVNSDYDEKTDLDAMSLIEKGMQPLDAIVWFSGQSRPAGLKIDVRSAADDCGVVANDIYAGFFAWYFSLYTQARAVAQGSPNFLTGVLAMGDDWAESITDLTSADINRFPDTWIKNVDLNGLSTKSRNRLALGAAGHRYIASLKYIRPQDFLPDSQAGAVFIAGIRNWTRDRVWWDLHPITKAGNIITVTGSINKLVEDCLAACVSPARLAQLSGARILHHVPQAVPSHSNWATFNLGLLPALTDAIF